MKELLPLEGNFINIQNLDSKSMKPGKESGKSYSNWVSQLKICINQNLLPYMLILKEKQHPPENQDVLDSELIWTHYL